MAVDTGGIEQNTLAIEVLTGVIRKDQAHVVLRRIGSGTVDINLLALGANEEIIGSWPVSNGRSGGAEESRPTEIAVESNLPATHAPIKSFVIAASSDSAAITYGQGFELKDLFYSTEKEFHQSKIARRRGNRPLDQETQMFQAKQMVVAYLPKVSRSLDLVASMIATYAYRATDIDDPDSARQSIQYIDDLISYIESCDASDYNQSWIISLLTAKWHAVATLRDIDQFVATLSHYFTNIDKICQNQLMYTMSYNIARSIVMLAAYRLMQADREAALQCFDVLSKTLRAGGALATLNHAHLREFAMTCRVCVAAGHLEANMLTENISLNMESVVPSLRKTYREAVLDLLVKAANRSYNPDKFVGYFEEMVAKSSS